jgi:hypothetical protein
MNDIALICIGSILHAATFAAGISVGIRLRKETRHDSNEGTKDQNWWHTPISTGVERGTGSGGQRGPWKESTANPAERPPFGRSSVWE